MRSVLICQEHLLLTIWLMGVWIEILQPPLETWLCCLRTPWVDQELHSHRLQFPMPSDNQDRDSRREGNGTNWFRLIFRVPCCAAKSHWRLSVADEAETHSPFELAWIRDKSFRSMSRSFLYLCSFWNWSMQLSQAVKSPLKLGRLICGNLIVILVGSICIVETGLIGWLDAAIILFAACRVLASSLRCCLTLPLIEYLIVFRILGGGVKQLVISSWGLSQAMLKLDCFIAQLVLVTIEVSTKVADLRIGSASVLSFLALWGGPEWILRDSGKATVSYEIWIDVGLVTINCG